jgi:hypothetical protein
MDSTQHAEPEVIYKGQVSDWTEHIPMLSSREGNELADQAAIEQAKNLGFSPDELELLGDVPLPPRPEDE